MSGRAEDPSVPAPPGDYIRGGGGVEVSRQRVATALLGVVAVVLLILVAVLAVEAALQNNRMTRLRGGGVSVNATVSTCVAMASGTGITEYGYQCRGTFTLDGHTYDEPIGGTTDRFVPGETVPAVVVPADPALLYTAASVAVRTSTWKTFATPAVLLLLAVSVIALMGRRHRTRRRDEHL
jgi:hypothetical protein